MPVNHADAATEAERWEAEAAGNRTAPVELDVAAGGGITDYPL